ncbi:MAG: ABC transporter permease [Streptosporangiaceae bacterium]
MSTAEAGGPGAGPGAGAVRQAGHPGPEFRPELAAQPVAPVNSWLRLLGSELRLVFGRRRSLALLAVLAAIPILIGIALRLQGSPGGGGGGGPAFLSQVTGNGVFLALAALTVLLILVLPLAVAVVAGDLIAGEAGLGTLRYLLAVPVGRTRLLFIKYAAVVIFGLAACLLVTVVSLVVGAALFPVGPVTLLSGTTVPLAAGLLRLLLVTLYVAAAMAALGAIGLAISTLTEHAIAAMAAILVIVVGSEVADSVSQFAVVHPFLPTHFWLSFDSLLRMPIDWPSAVHGLVSFGVYVIIFGLIAWARFTTADVTS